MNELETKVNQTERNESDDPICYLCSLPDPDTRDHIPPKNLFPKGTLVNALTLPSHKTCNTGFSLDEEYFRDNISALYAPNYEIIVNPIWNKAFRSLGYRPAKGADLRSRLGKAISLYAEDGRFLGESSEFKFSMTRTNRVLQKIAQGLLFFHTGKILRQPCRIGIHFHSDADRRIKPTRENTAIDYLQHSQYKGGWPPTFQYSGLVTTKLEVSIWWLLFYQAHLGIVTFDFGDFKSPTEERPA